jgi:hypothetical protein
VEAPRTEHFLDLGFLALGRPLKVARGPTYRVGRSEANSDSDFSDVLQRRRVIHVELDAFLKFPNNPFKLQMKTEDMIRFGISSGQ